jgi:hypothetical protein
VRAEDARAYVINNQFYGPGNPTVLALELVTKLGRKATPPILAAIREVFCIPDEIWTRNVGRKRGPKR